MPSRILAITNQKGGVGKTTTAINLAASLAAAEVPTLLVDCDPQCNASSGLGFGRDPARANLYAALREEIPARAAVFPTELEGLSLLPGTRDLVGVNFDLQAEGERETQLRRVLDTLRDDFAFIIVDCPPALDLLTLNALVAADALLVPMQCEYFALEGVSQLMETLESVRAAWNPTLEIEGVLFTQYDERTNLGRQVAENLRAHFGERIFKTTIPRNVRLAEAPSHGKPILLYDLRSRGAEAYLQLAKEVIAHEQSRRAAQSLGARAGSPA